MQYSARDLFQTQAELLEGKVDMAVSQAINRVIDRINGLERDLSNKMDMRFSSLESRVTALDSRLVAVETKLGMVADNKKTIRTKLIEYTLQAGWIGGWILVSYLIVHLHWAS